MVLESEKTWGFEAFCTLFQFRNTCAGCDNIEVCHEQSMEAMGFEKEERQCLAT